MKQGRKNSAALALEAGHPSAVMYMVLHGDNGEKNTLADGRAGVHALELPLKEMRETTLKLVFVNALLHLQSFGFNWNINTV